MTAHVIHAPPSAAVALPRATKTSASASRRPDPDRDHADHPQQHSDAALATAERELEADEQHRFAHWRAHSEHHFAVRKAMIARLQRLHPLLATDATMQYAGQYTRIPELVQRLELMLYKAAASLDEYTNLCTLERRVHSLVTLLEPLPAPSASVAPARRKRTASVSCGAPTTKRRRRAVSWSVSSSTTTTTLTTTVTVSARSPSRLTTQLSADLLLHVFGFVEGVDTLRSVARVNRFFRREAPRLVQTLRLDVADADHARALRGRVREALARCENLATLVVTNSRNVGKKHGFTRATVCPASETVEDVAVAAMPPTATPTDGDSTTGALRYTGRELLHELSSLWRLCAFPKLRRLELRAPFDCANEADATLACLHALASLPKPPSLEVLVLDTTLLGDRRVARLAALFRVFPQVFARHLHELELRNNFVGEAGMAALSRALASDGAWRRLTRLALPRNIVTDGDARALARCVAALPALAELDVSDNFIGKPGFEALAARLRPCDGPGGGDEGSVAVVSAHNCMEGSEAACLFR